MRLRVRFVTVFHGETIRGPILDDLIKLLQTLLDHGLVGWTVVLIAFWILCSNGKALLEGISSLLAEQKRVDGEERRADQEYAEAAERRRARQAKRKILPIQKALPSPDEAPRLLTSPAEKPSKVRASTVRRR